MQGIIPSAYVVLASRDSRHIYFIIISCWINVCHWIFDSPYKAYMQGTQLFDLFFTVDPPIILNSRASSMSRFPKAHHESFSFKLTWQAVTERDRERWRSSICWFTTPNGPTSKGWANLKPGTWIFIWISHVPSPADFPGCLSRELTLKWTRKDLNQHSNVRCQHHKCQLHLLCHNAGPILIVTGWKSSETWPLPWEIPPKPSNEGCLMMSAGEVSPLVFFPLITRRSRQSRP